MLDQRLLAKLEDGGGMLEAAFKLILEERGGASREVWSRREWIFWFGFLFPSGEIAASLWAHASGLVERGRRVLRNRKKQSK